VRNETIAPLNQLTAAEKYTFWCPYLRQPCRADEGKNGNGYRGETSRRAFYCPGGIAFIEGCWITIIKIDIAGLKALESNSGRPEG
jgi:hypothetical protein